MSGALVVNYLLMLALLGQADVEGGGGWQTETLSIDSTEMTICLPWLIENTLELTTPTDTLVVGEDFLWNDSTRILTVFPSSKNSVSQHVILRYRQAEISSQTHFQHYIPYISAENDSAYTQSAVFAQVEPSLDPFSQWRDLRKSGSLTRGVKFGESSEGTTSRMHLELSGNPKPDVRVDAVLDDQNLSAGSEASSATLSELERVLFRISTPRMYAEFGDWDIDWTQGKYGRVSKQLKGGRLALDLGAVEAEAAAGVSDLSYVSIRLTAKNGYLGPYELTDRYGNPGVAIASGSERVFLNGRQLKQGRNADYIIDYANGLLTFTPQAIITDNSRIEVEYEYLEGMYPRYFYGGKVVSSFGDDSATLGEFYNPVGQDEAAQGKGWRFNGSATIDMQDKNNPRSLTWNDEWLSVLEQAGDDRAKAIVNGADSVGVGKGDYIWSIIGEDTVLVFSLPDSMGAPTGYLSARFSRSNGGGYEQVYDADIKAVYYQWVGYGNGGWSPDINLGLPERTDHIYLGSAYQGGICDASLEAAFSDRDRNTLSALDDGDNTGMALSGSFKIGDVAENRLEVEVNSERREDQYQSSQNDRSVDYQYDWNIFSNDLGDEQAVSVSLATEPVAGLSFNAIGGLLDGSKGITSRRAGANGEIAVKKAKISFQADRVDSEDEEDIKRLRMLWVGGLSLDMDKFQPYYRFNSELNDKNVWLFADGKRLDSDHQAGFGYNWLDRQQFDLEYINSNQQREESSRLSQYSNAQTVKMQWQSVGHRQSAWNVALQRNWLNYKDVQIPDEQSTAATLDGRYADRKRGLMFQGQYNLATGDDRTRVTIAEYKGVGEGSYRREGDRYVPDPDGDFELKEVGIDSVARTTNVDFSGQVRWQKPKNSQRNVIGGLTSSLTRLELSSSTQRHDPLSAFLLMPQSFKGDELVYSHVLLSQRINFHEGGAPGEERLNARYDQTRDFSYSDGEYRRSVAIDYRIEQPLIESLSAIVEPQWEFAIRRSIMTGVYKAKVNTVGGEAVLENRSAGRNWVASLSYGYVQRREQTLDNQSLERSLAPRIDYQMTRGGSVRIETEWINYSTWKPYAGYDLLRGWDVGDNYQVTFVADYRLDKNFTLSAFYKGRWRGKRSPVHEGLAEVTVTL